MNLMKKILFVIIAALALPLMASAQSTTWKNDPAHSRLGFEVKHMSISTVKGYFSDFSAEVTYAKKDYSDMIIKVTAKVASINTGVEMRDNHLRSADFFDAEKYPEMTFLSSRIERLDDHNAKLYGQLTLHGITKPVELYITHSGTVVNPMNKQETAGFRISGSIDRKEYNLGMSFADNFISDRIDIIADAEFSPIR